MIQDPLSTLPTTLRFLRTWSKLTMRLLLLFLMENSYTLKERVNVPYKEVLGLKMFFRFPNSHVIFFQLVILAKNFNRL